MSFCTLLNIRFKILSISGASEFKIGPLQLSFNKLYHNMQMSRLTCPCALIRGRSKYFSSFFMFFFFKTMPKKTLNNDFTTLLPDFEEKLLKNLNEPSWRAKIENFSYFGQFVDLLGVLWGRNGPGRVLQALRV